MNDMFFLILLGLLAVSQARPESGYNYPQQQPSLQLNQGQSSSSFQQNLQPVNQVSVQGPQQHTLSQIQQSSSPFSSQSSNQYNLPSLSGPLPQVNYELLQQNIPQRQIQQSISYEQNLPQISQNFAPPPQQLALSQSQQSSSYQQSLPQVHGSTGLHSSQLSLPQASISYEQNLPQISQPIALSQSQQSSSYQQSLPQVVASTGLQSSQLSLPQASYGVPPLVNIFPQGNQVGANLDIPQNIPQLPIQSQNSIVIPNLQISQFQQNTLPSQGLPSIVSQQAPAPQLTIQSAGLPAQTSIVTKHVYVHVPPEEPPLPPQVIPAPLPPKKNYKIIFVKVPSQSSNQRQVIHVPAAQQTVEEKTLVYVLVDKPQQPQIVIPTPAPTLPSKPEVYFIKYKATSGLTAVAPPNVDIGGSPVGSQPIVEDLKRKQEQPINSGESSSSLFSGGLTGPSSKYGPPGYQKRNV